jgi:hypothetical protein
MSHGKAPKPVRQGGHAKPCECASATGVQNKTVNTVVSTPGRSQSRGVHVTPIGKDGDTIGKPGKNVPPPSWDF